MWCVCVCGGEGRRYNYYRDIVQYTYHRISILSSPELDWLFVSQWYSYVLYCGTLYLGVIGQLSLEIHTLHIHLITTLTLLTVAALTAVYVGRNCVRGCRLCKIVS